jgi:hypothetical protein
VLKCETSSVFVSLSKSEQLAYAWLSDKSINAVVQRYLGLTFSANLLHTPFVRLAKLAGTNDSEAMN